MDDKTQLDESTLVSALLEAAELRRGQNNRRNITIQRNKKPLFSFTVESLSESDWDKFRRQATKNFGKRNESFDSARFVSLAIYEATVDKSLWNNKSVWQKLKAVSGAEVVDMCLTPGEKSRIAQIIEDLSGYSEDDAVIIDDEIANF